MERRLEPRQTYFMEISKKGKDRPVIKRGKITISPSSALYVQSQFFSSGWDINIFTPVCIIKGDEYILVGKSKMYVGGIGAN